MELPGTTSDNFDTNNFEYESILIHDLIIGETTVPAGDLGTLGCGLKFLFLFSGYRHPRDFEHCCAAIGATAVLVDVEFECNGMDIMDQAVFEKYLGDITTNKFDGVIMAMPCSTFADAHQSEVGGFRSLRGAFPPELYGFRDLDLSSKERVRGETLLALRGAEAAKRCHVVGVPWLADTPAPADDSPSLLHLPEWVDLCSLPGVSRTTIGEHTLEPIVIWGEATLEGLPIDASLSSLQLCWQMVCRLALARRVMSTREGRREHVKTADLKLTKVGKWRNSLVLMPVSTDIVITDSLAVTSVNNLTPEMCNKVKVEPHIGDLRNIADSVRKIPGHLVLGVKVAEFLGKFLDDFPDVQKACLDAIGKDTESQYHVIDKETLLYLRKNLCDIFSRHGAAVAENAHHPSVNGLISSSVCGSLLHAWASAAGDPAAPVANWFTEGAPAAISIPMDELKGIMPEVPENDEDVADPADLTCDCDTFLNHGCLDNDPDAVAIISEYVDKGFLHRCGSLEECKKFLGGADPILNKFACIEKYKWVDATGEWKVKRRIIMDSLRSGVKAASRRQYKSVLPRITDAIASLIKAMKECAEMPMSEEEVEQFVIDATDAFWELGLRPEERRFFVGKVRGDFLVYLRTAQGSRGAPLSWAAVFGLVCRCVQAVSYAGHGSFNISMHTYVDDPWAVVKGTIVSRSRSIALMILCWRIIGIRLAFGKARRGPQLDWIGANLSVFSLRSVRATIMSDRLTEVRYLTEYYLSLDVMGVKDLRSYTGKVQSMASLLHTWRPFVAMLWAALYAAPVIATRAPINCIWVSQVREPMSWLSVFLSEVTGNIVRDFHVDAYANNGLKVIIYVDASPYGLGGFLEIDGIPKSYFWDAISDLDCEFLEIEHNVGSKGQQTFEALCLLVTMRLWLPDLGTQRITVAVRSDNIAALYMVARMQPKSRSLGIIARELALDLASASYAPDFTQHVAGIANGVADTLSRKAQPGKSFQTPLYLKSALEVHPPTRVKSWWRSKQLAKLES